MPKQRAVSRDDMAMQCDKGEDMTSLRSPECDAVARWFQLQMNESHVTVVVRAELIRIPKLESWRRKDVSGCKRLPLGLSGLHDLSTV